MWRFRGAVKIQMNKKLIATSIAVITLGAALALYNPWTPLGANLGSARVSHIGLHLAEGSQTIFMVAFSVDNPSRVPMVITMDEVTFQVNGTVYPSVVLGGDPVVLEPAEDVNDLEERGVLDDDDVREVDLGPG